MTIRPMYTTEATHPCVPGLRHEFGVIHAVTAITCRCGEKTLTGADIGCETILLVEKTDG